LSIKGIIFDFDGTLAHLNIDFEAMRQDVKKLAVELGHAQPWPDQGYLLEQVELVSGRLGDGFVHQAHRLIKERELAAARAGGLFPFTKSLIERAWRDGIKVGVVTRNCRDAVRLVFPDIQEACAAFISREDTERPKPDPGQIFSALDRMGLSPDQAVMVGDHPTDMAAGKAAGCRCIGVASGNTPAGGLREAGAEVVLPDASGLLKAIAGM
jgi:phosphoglycolate phosphatase